MVKERIKKEEKYKKEREELIERMNGILGIKMDGENNMFRLYDIQNEEKRDEINKLAGEIRLYFLTSDMNYYRDKEKRGDNRELGLIRGIYKQSGYKIEKKAVYVELEGKKRLTMEYRINKDK
jgi:hypothetical protein